MLKEGERREEQQEHLPAPDQASSSPTAEPVPLLPLTGRLLLCLRLSGTAAYRGSLTTGSNLWTLKKFLLLPIPLLRPNTLPTAPPATHAVRISVLL